MNFLKKIALGSVIGLLGIFSFNKQSSFDEVESFYAPIDKAFADVPNTENGGSSGSSCSSGSASADGADGADGGDSGSSDGCCW